MRIRPIAEHDRNSTDHLNFGVEFLVFFDALFRIPTIGLNLPEELVTLHHPGCVRLMMQQAYEFAVAKFVCEIGDIVREDMRMHIYFRERIACHNNKVTKKIAY